MVEAGMQESEWKDDAALIEAVEQTHMLEASPNPPVIANALG